MPGSRELKLPRLVEAREQRSTSSDLEQSLNDGRVKRISQASMSSEYSPITPTCSLQGHSRFPSSSSSLASSPAMRDSMEGFMAKRPLTEIGEEPHERDHESEPLQISLSRSEDLDPTSTAVATTPFPTLDDFDEETQADYDWVDGPYDENDERFDFISSKRRRGDSSPITNDNSSARFGGGIRSLSRKWRNRRDKRVSSIPDAFHEAIASRSRAGSTRAPSLNDARESFEYIESRPFPILSPSESFIEEPVSARDTPTSPIGESSEYEEGPQGEHEDDEAENASRTPLLPPVMAILKKDPDVVQSPLQSPKVVDSPRDPFDSPSAWTGLPSPPLSTRPSTSSFHHRQVVPPSDIPPISLHQDPLDEWAIKLGHANFTITPKPYMPSLPATSVSCQQLRADWDEARRNYAKHIAAVRVHHGAVSRIHQLTEKKWAGIDATWAQHNEKALDSLAASQSQEDVLLSQYSLSSELDASIKMPSITAPEGKFPKVSDKGIVGPMEVHKPTPQRVERKRGFWKFIQGMLPASVAWGRSN